MADAVDAVGDAGARRHRHRAAASTGDMRAIVLMLLTPADAATVCALLGLEPDSEFAPSALSEIGNIVGASYLRALARHDRPRARADAAGRLRPTCSARIVASVLAHPRRDRRWRLLLDSDLLVEGERCNFTFSRRIAAGAGELLPRLGVS